jgi:hypothetical protein
MVQRVEGNKDAGIDAGLDVALRRSVVVPNSSA